MAEVLKGLPVAKEINEKTQANIKVLKDAGITPKLAILRVGEKGDDIYYENAAVKKCLQLGIDVLQVHLEDTVSQKKLEDELETLNSDSSVHAILILRPLPNHLDDGRIAELIDPQKDIDGISPMSLYGVFAGENRGFVPCTARACMEMLKFYNIPVQGKKAVVIGRSLVIGKPAAMLLLKENATVTVCHSRTEVIDDIIRSGDIVISCAGKIGMVNEKCVRPGQVVIDVSMNTGSDGKMTGDADFDAVSQIVEAITPVPGGVGTMTTAIMLNNVTHAAMAQI